MNESRRSFLKLAAVTLASIPFAGKLLQSSPALAADADLPMASEKEEPAKSLKFCSNADKPSKNCAVRKDKAKDGQYCYSCQLFQKISGEGKKANGKCLVMVKNRVPGNGWCNSWVKNPAVSG